MKLSDLEKKIVVCCGISAELDCVEIAKRLRVSSHRVRYALDRLKDNNLIRVVPLIDIFRIGFFRYAIFVRFSPAAKGDLEKVIQQLKANPFIAHLVELTGEFDLQITMIGNAIETLYEPLKSFLAENLVYKKSLVVRQGITSFPRRYLTGGKIAPECLHIGMSKDRFAIDEVDMKLLKAIAHNPELSEANLSKETGIAPSTVHVRKRNLKERGIVTGYFLSTNPASYGYQGYLVLVKLRILEKSVRDKIHFFCANHENVTGIVEAIGEWDYEIAFEVESYQKFLRCREALTSTIKESLLDYSVVVRLHSPHHVPFPRGIELSVN